MTGKTVEWFQMNLPGLGDVPCKIVLSNRASRIGIRVLADGIVHLVVPSLCAILEAKSFLYEQRAYILKRLRAVAKVRDSQDPMLARADYPTSLPLAFFGQDWHVHYDWMPIREICFELQPEVSTIRIFGSLFHPEIIMKCLGKALQRLSLISLKDTLDDWSLKMNMPYGRMATRLQRGRWGSCSGRNDISLNAQLLFFPGDIVEYVMIHELCHTVEHNHSPAFWALVKRYCPDYVQREKRQNELAQKLSALFSRLTGA